jgi:hypothetical protein
MKMEQSVLKRWLLNSTRRTTQQKTYDIQNGEIKEKILVRAGPGRDRSMKFSGYEASVEQTLK